MDNKPRETYDPIEILQYEKMADDIMQLGRNSVSRINVSLNKFSNGVPYYFHKEYEYQGRNPKLRSVSVKRSYDYYISIENYTKPQGLDKAFIRIGVREFTLFKERLKEVIAWFTDKKHAKLFAKTKEGNVSVTAPVPSVDIENLPMGKWIRFEPIVIEHDDSKQEPGVRMYLSDPLNYSDLSIDILVGYYEILRTMNMFMSAQSMVPKLSLPIATNRYSIDDGTSYSYTKHIETTVPKTSSITGRKIGQTKPKLGDLEGE